MNHVCGVRMALKQVRWLGVRGHVSDFNPYAVPLNKQISAYSRSHNWRKSIELLEDALKHCHAVNVVSFGAALAACDRGSFWPHALHLFSRLGSTLASPNTITWNATISACSRAKQWQHACGLLGQMMETNFQPDTITFNSTMRSLEGTGSSSSRWHLGMVLYDQLWLNRLLPSRVTWSTVTNLCAQGNAWHVALVILKQALQAADSEHPLDAASVTSVLIACARSRRWQRSVQLFSEMFSTFGSRPIRPDRASFNAAMTACERGGHWSGALHLMHEMNRFSVRPDLTSVNALLSACEKGCKWQESLTIFSTHLPGVVSSLVTQPSSQEYMVTYTALLAAVTTGGQWPAAFAILDDMRKKQLQPGPLHLAAVLEAMPGEKVGERSAVPPETISVAKLMNLSLLDALHHRQHMENSPRDRCQEVTKYIVAGLESLLRKVRPEDVAETLTLFRTVVFQPVVSCLLLLSRAESEEERTSALSNVRLEEQFGLGSFFTAEALRALGFSCTDVDWQRAESGALQALCQRPKCLEGSSEMSRAESDAWYFLPEKALAQQLVVWLAYDLVHRDGSHDRHFTMKGRPQFASKQDSIPTEEVPLSSVFVEHDRSNHAERWALFSVIADLLAEGLQPRDFCSVRGTVQLYAVHTPCISCLAAFCQFQSAFPRVSLKVGFKDWRTSRATIHRSRNKDWFGLRFGFTCNQLPSTWLLYSIIYSH